VGGLTPIFWQNTLPLMVTILVAVGAATLAGWISNANMSKRIDDLGGNLSKRIDDVGSNLSKRIDDLGGNLSRRMDDTNANVSKRLDEVIARLGRIETKLEGHEDRITRLEERTSPLRR
jgi:hypothetical protein